MQIEQREAIQIAFGGVARENEKKKCHHAEKSQKHRLKCQKSMRGWPTQLLFSDLWQFQPFLRANTPLQTFEAF